MICSAKKGYLSMTKTKIFLIPHAGGSARSYLRIKRYLDSEKIELIPLDTAGRGARTKEKCFEDVKSCVRDLYEKMAAQLEDEDYIIFGHSLGSILAYELTEYLMEKKKRLPRCLIVSGRVSPDANFDDFRISKLDDEHFLKKLAKFQALPAELEMNSQIKELFMPVLRSDIRMSDNYQFQEKMPVSCDLYAFYGDQDQMVSSEEIEEWERFGKKKVEIAKFSGGHFYFKENERAFADKLNQIVYQY